MPNEDCSVKYNISANANYSGAKSIYQPELLHVT